MRYAGATAILLMTMASAALGQPADPPAPVRAPYQLVRTLQALQDRIAHGSLDAHRTQIQLIEHLNTRLAGYEPEVWRDKRNARAAVVYLLSGGAPDVIRKIAAHKTLNIDEKLVNGALAYVEGREKEALELLGGVEARSLPAMLNGHIALVQSALLARTDPRATIQNLDDARLLMPGTLIEEAALRREIYIAGQIDDFEKFEFLATQYMRRFPHSVYVGNFRQRFAIALMRFSFAQDSGRFARLVVMLDHLDVASRRTLYLLVAHTALVRGRTDMAHLAAEQAVALAELGSPEGERARLYRASVRIVSGDYEQGLSELQTLDKALLPESDGELLDAAFGLARNVRKPLPEAVRPQSDMPKRPAQALPKRIDFGSSSAMLAQAQKVLRDLEPILKEEKP